MVKPKKATFFFSLQNGFRSPFFLLIGCFDLFVLCWQLFDQIQIPKTKHESSLHEIQYLFWKLIFFYNEVVFLSKLAQNKKKCTKRWFDWKWKHSCMKGVCLVLSVRWLAVSCSGSRVQCRTVRKKGWRPSQKNLFARSTRKSCPWLKEWSDWVLWNVWVCD